MVLRVVVLYLLTHGCFPVDAAHILREALPKLLAVALQSDREESVTRRMEPVLYASSGSKGDIHSLPTAKASTWKRASPRRMSRRASTYHLNTLTIHTYICNSHARHISTRHPHCIFPHTHFIPRVFHPPFHRLTSVSSPFA